MESKNIHNETFPIYGEKCPSRQAVYSWVQKFSEGRTRIEDEHRIGRPTEIATEANVQRVEDLIRVGRRVTIRRYSPCYWFFTRHGLPHNAWQVRFSQSLCTMGAAHAEPTTQNAKNGSGITASQSLPRWRTRHASPNCHRWRVLGSPLPARDHCEVSKSHINYQLLKATSLRKRLDPSGMKSTRLENKCLEGRGELDVWLRWATQVRSTTFLWGNFLGTVHFQDEEGDGRCLVSGSCEKRVFVLEVLNLLVLIAEC
jgi:hypothetical protein